MAELIEWGPATLAATRDLTADIAAAKAKGAAAAEKATEGTRPTSDIHGSAEYREHLARVLTRRAVMSAAGL